MPNYPHYQGFFDPHKLPQPLDYLNIGVDVFRSIAIAIIDLSLETGPKVLSEKTLQALCTQHFHNYPQHKTLLLHDQMSAAHIISYLSKSLQTPPVFMAALADTIEQMALDFILKHYENFEDILEDVLLDRNGKAVPLQSINDNIALKEKLLAGVATCLNCSVIVRETGEDGKSLPATRKYSPRATDGHEETNMAKLPIQLLLEDDAYHTKVKHPESFNAAVLEVNLPPRVETNYNRSQKIAEVVEHLQAKLDQKKPIKKSLMNATRVDYPMKAEEIYQIYIDMLDSLPSSTNDYGKNFSNNLISRHRDNHQEQFIENLLEAIASMVVTYNLEHMVFDKIAALNNEHDPSLARQSSLRSG